jgi:hypothetical protein
MWARFEAKYIVVFISDLFTFVSMRARQCDRRLLHGSAASRRARNSQALRSASAEATIHMQNLSGNETRVLRNQERQCIGSIDGSTRALYRLHRNDEFHDFVYGRAASRSSRDKTHRGWQPISQTGLAESFPV